METIFDKIRLLIQSGLNIIIALFKTILLSRFFVELPKIKDKNIALLANGPSLDEALSKMRKSGMSKHIMVTNHFCKSTYFVELKPDLYTICDPAFKYVGFRNNVSIREFYDTLFSATWKIYFFVPFSFANDLSRIMEEGGYHNRLIHIKFYNNVNFNGDGDFLLRLMHLKLGLPRVATVAIPAIFLCMYLGAEVVHIGGIDLNQHQDIVVDKDNVLKLRSVHFYSNNRESSFQPWRKANGETYTISEIFQVFYRFFYSFDIASKYAQKYGVEIINYSKRSFLDQFKKV